MCQDIYQQTTHRLVFCGHSIPINLKNFEKDSCTFFHGRAQHAKQENNRWTKRWSGWSDMTRGTTEKEQPITFQSACCNWICLGWFFYFLPWDSEPLLKYVENFLWFSNQIQVWDVFLHQTVSFEEDRASNASFPTMPTSSNNTWTKQKKQQTGKQTKP